MLLFGLLYFRYYAIDRLVYLVETIVKINI